MSTVGYIYEAEALEGPLTSISMAPHTIAGMFALSAGLLCARPARGAMAWLASAGPQGLLLRQLLPSGIAILLATAFIAEFGHKGGVYGAAHRAALELSTAIVLLSALVLWAAAVLARLDAARAAVTRAYEKTAAYLKASTEASVDGIITADERGMIETVNPAATRHFGFTAQEMIGRNVSMLMPEQNRSRLDCYLQHYFSTGARGTSGGRREVRGLRKDGAQFPLELAVSETRVDGHRLFTGIVRDISSGVGFSCPASWQRAMKSACCSG